MNYRLDVFKSEKKIKNLWDYLVQLQNTTKK